MMKNIFWIILIIISFGARLEAQDFSKQKREFAFVNIGINGIVSGFGALVNKKKGERPLNVFVKGFGQGCLGGGFQVLGKELTYQIKSKNNLSYVWVSRTVNSIGNSIVQNAASNINFWEQWHFNIGVLRLDYKVRERKFQARLFLSSIYGVIVAGSQAKLNLKKTLQSGIMIYERDGFVSIIGMQSIGIATVSSIAIDKNIKGNEFYDLIAHETMHILQYDNIVWVNPFFKKVDEKWRSKSNFYKKAGKYVYLDLNGLTMFGLYFTQIKKPWICRFIEREAEHFSQRETLPNCN